MRRKFARVRRVADGVAMPSPEPLYSLVYGSVQLLRSRARGEALSTFCRLSKREVGSAATERWVQSYVMGLHLVSTWDPELIRQVLFLKEDEAGKQDFGKELTQRFISESILSAEGEQWKCQKAQLSAAFAYEHLQCITPEINQVAEQLVEVLQARAGAPIVIHPLLQQATLDVIGSSGFGVQFNALSEYHKSAALRTYEQLMLEFQNPIHFYERLDRLLGSQRKLTQLMDEFEQFMLALIERKRQLIAEQGESYVARDILDLLLAANHEGALTARQLMHNLNAFFIAGHETSAAALFSILSLLAQHPAQQQRLAQEIAAACGTSPPTYHQLKDMDYLHRVIKESLRLYPPAPLMIRRLKKDLQIGEYHLPAETSVALFVHAIQRDERYWRNPDQFEPDRFTDEHEEDKAKRHRYAFMPFSLGPRQCIGNNFAMLEIKVLLVRILQHFRLSADPLCSLPPFLNQPHPNTTLVFSPRE